MATIVHFEIPTDNAERAIRFYDSLFGWKAEKMSNCSMDYWMFTTTGKGNEGQMIGGGIMKRMQDGQSITIYIDVDSISEYSKKVERLGGKVMTPKTEVPGYGWFAICTDTENNAFGLWEPSASSK